MSYVKFNIIVATDNKGGIAKNNVIPWKDDPQYKNELAFFVRQTLSGPNPFCYNAVIMGRKTWETIDVDKRPLRNRINIILTRNKPALLKKYPTIETLPLTHVMSSLNEALSFLNEKRGIGTTWVVGGAELYEEALKHEQLDSVIVSEIPEDYGCDKKIELNMNDLVQIAESSEIYDLYGTPVSLKRYVKGQPENIVGYINSVII